MIPTLYYAIGFLVYIGSSMITFNVYSKKNEEVKIYYLIFIYLFYTVLSAYVISFSDVDGSNSELIVQTLIYSVTGGIILYHHYNSIIEIEDKKNEDFSSKL